MLTIREPSQNITLANQGCPIPGSAAGVASVTGPEYLSAQFNYFPSHAWRNFGIILCFWVGYTVLQAVAQTYMTKRGEGSIVGRVYKRGAVIPGETNETVHKTEKELDVEAQSHAPSLTGQTPPNDSSGSVTQVEDGEPPVSFDGKVCPDMTRISDTRY